MAAQIAVSSCIEMRSNPGYYLRSDAAKAWDRAVAAFGKLVLITGAWRSYETQERIFRERYRRGNYAGRSGYTTDVRYWPRDGHYWTRLAGTAAAAVPGTSNHGGGVAVDVKTSRAQGDPPYAEAVIFGSWTDPDRARFLRVAAEHGWDDDEGRSVGELWHITYYPDRDQHRGEAVPAPPQEEEEMPSSEEIAKAVWNYRTRVPSNLVKYLGKYNKMSAIVIAAAFRAKATDEDTSRLLREVGKLADEDQ